MKNIMKVFLTDARRLSVNVVAIVIIMGLSIIPALYAWFNILSNWDPYGESATSQMHIAVYSEDAGVTYGKLFLNMGDTVVEGLESNTTIGWVFSDTREEALRGVYNGEYYAAFIIPENFTEDMLSFVKGEVNHPVIEYYENSKKNAIATKITSKVKTTIQNQVNTSVVSKLTELASKSGELLSGETVDDKNLVSGIQQKLRDMDKELNTYVNILNTLSLLTSSTTGLVGSAQSLLPNAQELIQGSQGAISGMQNTVLAGAETADTITSMIDISMDSIRSGLDNLQKQIEILDAGSEYATLAPGLSLVDELMRSTLEVIKSVDGVSKLESYQKMTESYSRLVKDMDKFTEDEDATEKKVKLLKKSLLKEIEVCKEGIEDLKSDFDYRIAPSLNQTVYTVESSLISAQNMLVGLDDDFPQVDRALQAYADTLELGTDSILETQKDVVEIQKGLQRLIRKFDNLESDEQYQQVLDILKTDPTLIAEFVAAPIQLETVKYYEIENYGSAMASFYTVLALWVGGLIMVALIHVKVKDCKQVEGTRFWHRYFGRYLTFFLIGQAQTMICVLGDLFYIKIQCQHPFLFWVASALTSLVFTIFMYSLTVAFGNVGQAIAVVVMVIQVAGAGGTFPVEVLPQVYQMLYKYLPFTYSMNALRECVGGMYHMDYLKDLGVLGIYLVASIVVGLVCTKPFQGLNQIIERSKEKSGVMM